VGSNGICFEPDDRYNAFLTTCKKPRTDQESSPVAVAVKDNISTKGIETTCASKILKGYIPPYDAHVVELLRTKGAAIVGKTNMDEFGMGTTTENSAFGPTLNPCDTDVYPAGHPAEVRLAVAGGMVRMALGTDTGGSIRCPAAFCGIVGLKPTYGRVSRYGLIAYANSLEQIGPMGRTVSDVSALMQVIAGYDRREPRRMTGRISTPLRRYQRGTDRIPGNISGAVSIRRSRMLLPGLSGGSKNSGPSPSPAAYPPWSTPLLPTM